VRQKWGMVSYSLIREARLLLARSFTLAFALPSIILVKGEWGACAIVFLLSLDRFNAYNLRDKRKALSRIRRCNTKNDSLRRDVSRLGSSKVFYIRWKAG